MTTLRWQINEWGGKSASRVGLVDTFFCLFVWFFSVCFPIFPPYSFIWHLRIGPIDWLISFSCCEIVLKTRIVAETQKPHICCNSFKLVLDQNTFSYSDGITEIAYCLILLRHFICDKKGRKCIKTSCWWRSALELRKIK